MKSIPVFLTQCLILCFSFDINANSLEVSGNFTGNDVFLNATVPQPLSLYVSTVTTKEDDTSKEESSIVTVTPASHVDDNRTIQIIPTNQSSVNSSFTNQDTISLKSLTMTSGMEIIELIPGTTSSLTSTIKTNDKILSDSVTLPEHSVKASVVSITTGSTPRTITEIIEFIPGTTSSLTSTIKANEKILSDSVTLPEHPVKSSVVSITTGSTPRTITTFNWKPYASLASKWVDFTSFTTTTTTEETETSWTDETETEDMVLAAENEGTTTSSTVETTEVTTDEIASSTTDETTTSTTSISSFITAFNWKPYVPQPAQETTSETVSQNDDKENQLLHGLVETTTNADAQSPNSNTSLLLSETAASINTADTVPSTEVTSNTSLHVPTSNTTVLTTTATSSSASLKSEISSTGFSITNNDSISTITSTLVSSTAVSATSSTNATIVDITSSTSSSTTTSSISLSSTTIGTTTTFNWRPFIPPNSGSQTSNVPSSATTTPKATVAAETTTTTSSSTSHKSHHRKGHGTAVKTMSSQSVAGILLITLTIAISCTATAVFTIQRYRRQRMLEDSVALMSSRRSHGRVYYYDTSI